MIAAEIKKLHLRVFALIDIGVRRFVVRDVVEGHSRSLLAQLISHERDAGALQRSPHLFNIIVVHHVRTANGERIQRYRQDRFERCQSIAGHKQRLYDVRPMSVARSDGKLILITNKNAGVGTKAGWRRFIDQIHVERLIADIFYCELKLCWD